MFTKNYLHRNSACPQRKNPLNVTETIFFLFFHSFFFFFLFFVCVSFFEKHVPIRYRQRLALPVSRQPRCRHSRGRWVLGSPRVWWVPGDTCRDLGGPVTVTGTSARGSRGCPGLELLPLGVFRPFADLPSRRGARRVPLVNSEQKSDPEQSCSLRPCPVSQEGWKEKASDGGTVN